MRNLYFVVAPLVVLGALTVSDSANPGRVTLLRVPNGGIQPQAVAGRDDAIHLLYFAGKAMAGDLFYCRADSKSLKFSSPIRVNSQPGSAVAVGTIRGGQLALGKNGRVHVVWNGSRDASPKPALGGSPLLYSRLNGGAFEPQRNLMQRTSVLDGGGTVAADSAGNVYALWHGNDAPSGGEAARKMWIARSRDDGATFGVESAANPEPTGACACCGTRALAANDGTLFALYRGAAKTVERDMHLLVSNDRGATFRSRSIHPWNLPT